MNNVLHEIDSCEVCGNRKLISVLDLGLHPMCDDLVPVGDDRVCREYPIEILFCENCITAHQRFQVPKQDLFPTSYHYRSRFTKDVLDGMAGLVDSCVERFGDLSSKKVLDIGCNDGSLLDFFREKGALTIGLEPTDASNDAKAKGHIIFNDFLSKESVEAIVLAHGSPDLITFTNVFAHIENLDAVLNSLKQLIAPHTLIIIENHYLGAVLEGNQFDTFYHEHPRSYSYSSFVHIAQSLDAELIDVEFSSRYGGNIRVFISASSFGHHKFVDTSKIGEKEGLFLQDFAVLRKNVISWKDSKKHFLASHIKQYGKLRAKAFPGRAAILIKLLGLTENQITAVYEKPGSLKIGHYLPGTRIPICSDEDLFALSNKNIPILNLAWHIPNEISRYLIANGCVALVTDIISDGDFNS